MIITKTPFRVSLFGGGSDHPQWFLENGGQVISFTINKFCYIKVRVLPPFFEHKYRVTYSQVETESDIENIKHPVVRECIRQYAPGINLEIHHDSDLPARSGVGSSSAFTVGMINALQALQSRPMNANQLAKHAIHMEQITLRENVGWQDQIACALGGLNCIEFTQEPKWIARKIQISKTRIQELESRMVLVYTGIERNSSDINQTFLENLTQKRNSIFELVQMAKECADLLVSNKDFSCIGNLLDESWKLKRSLNPNASNPNLDEFYARAKKCGALGGKILGAGGGGFFLFWLEENRVQEFIKNFTWGISVPIQIESEGSRIIFKS